MYQFCEGIISIFPEIPKPEYSKPFHRNISIEENEFHPFDFPVLYAKSADGISFTGNKLIRSHRFLPFHHRRSIFTFENCLNISIKANSFESDVLGKNVTLASTPLKQVKLDKQQKLIIEK